MYIFPNPPWHSPMVIQLMIVSTLALIAISTISYNIFYISKYDNNLEKHNYNHQLYKLNIQSHSNYEFTAHRPINPLRLPLFRFLSRGNLLLQPAPNCAPWPCILFRSKLACPLVPLSPPPLSLSPSFLLLFSTCKLPPPISSTPTFLTLVYHHIARPRPISVAKLAMSAIR